MKILNPSRRIQIWNLKCSECGQKDIGQTGEYPCPKCGLPTFWDKDDIKNPKMSKSFLYADELVITRSEWINDAYYFEMQRQYRIMRIRRNKKMNEKQGLYRRETSNYIGRKDVS